MYKLEMYCVLLSCFFLIWNNIFFFWISSSLIKDLLNTMEATGADFTNTFCCFLSVDSSDYDKVDSSLEKVEENILKQCYPIDVLIKSCKPDMSSE